MAKVRVVSDGTAVGTHVLVGGEEVDGVRSLTFHAAADEDVAFLTLSVWSPVVDVESLRTLVAADYPEEEPDDG